MTLIEFYDYLKRNAGCTVGESTANSRIVEHMILRHSPRPVPTSYRQPAGKLRGAMVQIPPMGLHEDVGVFDIKSQYPIIIESANISFETLIENIDQHDGKYSTIRWEDETGTWHENYFTQEYDGVMRIITRLLRIQRDELRAIRHDPSISEERRKTVKANETSVKFINTSTYGVLGYPAFPWYNPVVANCVTGEGRSTLGRMGDVAEDNGWDSLYGDTDSSFIGIKDHDWEAGYVVEQVLNEDLEAYSRERGFIEPITVKYEKFARVIFFKPEAKITKTRGIELLPIGKKKGYAMHRLMLDDRPVDDLLIMGFPSKRSDVSGTTSNAMERFFQLTLVEKNLEAAVVTLRKAWQRLIVLRDPREHVNDLNDVATPLGLNNHPSKYNPPNLHHKGSMYAETYFDDHKWEFGQKPLMVPVKPKYVGARQYPAKLRLLWKDDAWEVSSKRYDKMYDVASICSLTGDMGDIPDDFWDEFEVDVRTLREKLLKKKFQELVLPFGLVWDNILGQQQLNLGKGSVGRMITQKTKVEKKPIRSLEDFL